MIRLRTCLQAKIFVFTVFLVFSVTDTASSQETKIMSPGASSDLSLKNEVQHAIERGLRWLGTQQSEKGYWSQPDHPALSALVLTAFMGEPSGRVKAKPPSSSGKGMSTSSGAFSLMAASTSRTLPTITRPYR